MTTYNVSNMSAINFNNTSLDKVIYDGVTVWESWVYKTTPITKTISSSSGGWNTEYNYNSGWINFSPRIKNPTISLSTTLTDGSAAKSYIQLKYLDGTTSNVCSTNVDYAGGGGTKTDTSSTTITNGKEITSYCIYASHWKFGGNSSNTATFKNYYQRRV